MNDHKAIAHVREKDQKIQHLETHLMEVAALSAIFAGKVGLPYCGRLLGLLHDLGKYSEAFQVYIQEVTGLLGEHCIETGIAKRGTIDHATSGAQIIWDAVDKHQLPKVVAQVLSVVVMSHHSTTGMKDFMDLNGKSPFLNRLDWKEDRTHKKEAWEKCAPHLKEEIEAILSSGELTLELQKAMVRIRNGFKNPTTERNALALLTRFLFSCLLDADRVNTIDFESPQSASFRNLFADVNWQGLTLNYEKHIEKFVPDTQLNKARMEISNSCRQMAASDGRIFRLRIPTGGGKTLASLRFALHRAMNEKTHKVDRIIYVVPFTSILDQNAREVSEILGEANVLEHHSNISPEKDTWRTKVLSENWDAPIVFTTTVQFLNSLYAGGTKTARRMHQLSNAIIIFDEVQALPIKTLHLFNNAVNFLKCLDTTTSVLCTATMPLLHKLDEAYGALNDEEIIEIVPNIDQYASCFQRTFIHNMLRPLGWTYSEVYQFGREQQSTHGSLLIICNKKESVQMLYELFNEQNEVPVILLSTDMCPAHRKERIDKIRLSLKEGQPLICISTQLIEAGVDLDFRCVIRSLAGLDSIAQAAGRCNRHGKRENGDVYVLNFSEERIPAVLNEIKVAQDVTRTRVLAQHKGEDLTATPALETYYEHYYYQRKNLMTYPVKDTSIIDLLGENIAGKTVVSELITPETQESYSGILGLKLHHAYTTACEHFRVIDAPTSSVIVPYVSEKYNGAELIGKLSASFTNDEVPLKSQIKLIKQAQQYSVNLFPHKFKKLQELGAIKEIHEGEGIFHLDERYYHSDLGVTDEPSSKLNTLIT